MTILQALILGVIEGLTEFLPVSSTAHILLTEKLLGVPADQTAFIFTVLVQLGAIAALVLYFWSDLWSLLLAFLKGIRTRKPFEDFESRLAWLVILASIPTLAIGYLTHDLVTDLFADPLASAGLRLLMTTAILTTAELLYKAQRPLTGITWLDALWIGVVQVLTILPGSSRSGAAILGGMSRGLDRSSATRFAFLMSVPIMSAAGIYEGLGALTHETLSFLPVILVGLVAAGISGWYSIRWLVNYVSKRSLYPFAAYCLVLGVICFAAYLIH